MAKGIDSKFLHYGIRARDMNIIDALCREAEIDPDWFKEYVLKAYHEEKMKKQEVDDKALKRIVNRSLNQLP